MLALLNLLPCQLAQDTGKQLQKLKLQGQHQELGLGSTKGKSLPDRLGVV